SRVSLPNACLLAGQPTKFGWSFNQAAASLSSRMSTPRSTGWEQQVLELVARRPDRRRDRVPPAPSGGPGRLRGRGLLVGGRRPAGQGAAGGATGSGPSRNGGYRSVTRRN